MKIACFREFSDPESTLFKNIINFSVDLFSFLNPPTVVPPTFSHFSPTHPFFLSFHRASLASLFSLLFSTFSAKDTRLRRVSFFPSRGSVGIGEQVIPDAVTYVYIVSLPLRFILCVTGQALVLLLRSHLLYLFVTGSRKYESFSFENVPIKSYCVLRAVLSRYLTFAKT